MGTQKQSKEEIAAIKAKLAAYIGVPIRLSFGLSFDTVIEDIVLARLADLKNAPEKRSDGNKFYTPPVVMFKCAENNTFSFVLEDIQDILLTLNGAVIRMPTMEVCIKRVRN